MLCKVGDSFCSQFWRFGNQSQHCSVVGGRGTTEVRIKIRQGQGRLALWARQIEPSLALYLTTHGD